MGNTGAGEQPKGEAEQLEQPTPAGPLAMRPKPRRTPEVDQQTTEPTDRTSSGSELAQREHLEDVLRVRRAHVLAAYFMPAFFLFDAIHVRYVGPGSFWKIFGLRLLTLPAFVIANRWYRKGISPRSFRQLTTALQASLGISFALMAIETGGFRSYYGLGLALPLGAYGTFLPQRWQKGLPHHAAIWASYPLCLLAFSPFSSVLTAQWHEPAALATGAIYLMLSGTVAGASVAGGHLMWALRKQVFEARIIGRYRLIRPLGSGGMGEVWAAHHPGLRRDVAVKILRPESADPTAVQRFELEAKSTSDLCHPNTVRVFDYGTTEDGLCFYVMELLEGSTLGNLLREEAPLDPRRAVSIAEQACNAIAEAHDNGIIHRDIKPANLFLTSAGRRVDFVKVLDFGIARVMSEDAAEPLTQTGLVAGTPAFMAPEVAGGQRADKRSDVYSLGAVLYLCLTGYKPFEEANSTRMMMAHLNDAVVPPSVRLGMDLPRELEELVMKALAKEPEARFRDAAEMAEALEACDLSGLRPMAHSGLRARARLNEPTPRDEETVMVAKEG